MTATQKREPVMRGRNVTNRVSRAVNGLNNAVPGDRAVEVVAIPRRPIYPVFVQRGRERAASAVHGAPSFAFEIEHEDGYWIVRDANTGIFGYGEDFAGAAADFQAAVVEHLDVLKRQPALSQGLSWQLEYLRARVGR